MSTLVMSGIKGSHCLARIMALRLSACSPLGARTTCPCSQAKLQDCRPCRVPKRETPGPASTPVLWTIHRVLYCRQEVTHAITPACAGAPAHCRATQYTSPMLLVTRRPDSADQATLRRDLTASSATLPETSREGHWHRSAEQREAKLLKEAQLASPLPPHREKEGSPTPQGKQHA